MKYAGFNMKIIRAVLLTAGSILALLILAYAGYGFYFSSKVNAMPEVKKFTDLEGRRASGGNYITNDKNGDYLIFPGKKNKDEGVIIYPAAFSDEKGYIPEAFKFADEGYSVFIAKMPLRLSMLNTENGLNYTLSYKNIKKWYIIGHSQGGLAASVFADKHPDKISGLILMASGPLPDMKKSKIKSLLFFATRDGYFSRAAFEAAKKGLPADTDYYTIEGGNHSQFGLYPLMPGDKKAGITLEEQQKEVIAEILKFLK